MRKRNLIVGAMILAVLGVYLLMAPATDRLGYFVLGGSAAAVIAVSSWLMYRPWFVAFVDRHPRRFRLAGWTIVAIGIAVTLGYPALTVANLAPLVGFEVVLEGAVILALAGFMIASFPRMIGQVKLARSKLEAQKGLPPQPSTFSPLKEGCAAALTILRSPVEYLQIAGPWAAMISATALGAIALVAPAKVDRGAAFGALALIAISVVLLILSLPTIGVAWARWVGQGRRPIRFVAMPDGAAISVMWRLWIFNAVEAAIDKPVSAYVATVWKSAGLGDADAVGDVAGWVVEILAIVLAGIFAVRLAAIALGDRNFRVIDLGAGRGFRPMLGAGLVVALAPAVLAVAGFNGLYEALAGPHSIDHPSAPTALWVFVEVLLLLAAFASGAAYLTRAYQTIRPWRATALA